MSGIRCPMCDYSIFDCNCSARFGESREKVLNGIGGWRPIENAPSNEPVLLWDDHFEEVVIGYFSDVKDEWLDDRTEDTVDSATKWMPLPEPPEE